MMILDSGLLFWATLYNRLIIVRRTIISNFYFLLT